MVKPIELKQGSIILYKGRSYYILGVTDSLDCISLQVGHRIVSCQCGGNIMKRGTQKGQYECLSCHQLVWLNSEGERVEA
jgi:hypothetical protein